MSAIPNIIVIKTDQQRFDTTGFSGNACVKTPNLDLFAEGATVFENAFCCSPLCVPSRTSFFSGDYVNRTGCTGNMTQCHLSSKQGSLLDHFHSRGVNLALAGKNHAFQEEYRKEKFIFWEEYDHWTKCAGQGIAQMEKLHRFRQGGLNSGANLLMEGLIEGPEPFAQEECITWKIGEDAIDFIDRHGEEPFFLHVSFPDPHFPNIVCEPYHSMYNPSDLPPLKAVDMDWTTHPFAHFVQSRAYDFHKYTEDDVKRIVATYYGQITFIDTALGRLFDKLKDKGLYNDALIIFTSDHGDFAGNYKLVGKTKAFYDSLVRIPLAIKFPNSQFKGRTSAQVSNIDVMPTVMDYCGLSIPDIQGKSFLPSLQGNTQVHREEIFAELGYPLNPPPPVDMQDYPEYSRKRSNENGMGWFIDYTVYGRAAMIRREGWKYCYYTGDSEELYNLDEDPLEVNNLAANRCFEAKRAELHNRLLDWVLRSPVEREFIS